MNENVALIAEDMTLKDFLLERLKAREIETAHMNANVLRRLSEARKDIAENERVSRELLVLELDSAIPLKRIIDRVEDYYVEFGYDSSGCEPDQDGCTLVFKAPQRLLLVGITHIGSYLIIYSRE